MAGGGGSFLGTAAAAAAGVVGGSLLLNGIRSMMGGQHGAQAGPVADRHGVEIRAVEVDAAGVGGLVAGQCSQQRRLARAVGPGDDGQRARRHVEIDVAEGGPIAEVDADAAEADAEGGLLHGGGHRPSVPV